MFFGFQLTLGLMMVFYGYSVMKNPRVWGDQGRRAVKAEHFEEYCRQNGLFFLKAGCVVAVIGALDALITLDALLYALLYLFGLAFAFYPLVKWCRENEGFIGLLQSVIRQRHRDMPEGSYTTKLFTKGAAKIAQKVGEEAVETVIEAVANNNPDLVYEASDLIYHLLVLLENQGLSIADLEEELAKRHK